MASWKEYNITGNQMEAIATLVSPSLWATLYRISPNKELVGRGQIYDDGWNRKNLREFIERLAEHREDGDFKQTLKLFDKIDKDGYY
tara:strand:+ start:815 stop:1075 length:261 start_codon:yes stop_codon:yes gene_type:complete